MLRQKNLNKFFTQMLNSPENIENYVQIAKNYPENTPQRKAFEKIINAKRLPSNQEQSKNT